MDRAQAQARMDPAQEDLTDRTVPVKVKVHTDLTVQAQVQDTVQVQDLDMVPVPVPEVRDMAKGRTEAVTADSY